MKLVVDCAHGAAYDVAPHVFHELGAEVIPIGVSPNGFNINDGVGATAPDALVRAVRANHADLGIALDGDADRLQVVDAAGRLFNGDELLYVLVKDRIATAGHVEGAVGTLMTNMAVEVALQHAGVKFVRAAVGDRYVLEQLREHGWQLGAEGSGHILSLDRHSTGDGIVSALLVLAAMQRSGKSLAELLDGVTLFPQKLINVRMKPGADWKGSDTIRRAIRGGRRRARRPRPRADSRVGHRARAARDGRGAERRDALQHSEAIADAVQAGDGLIAARVGGGRSDRMSPPALSSQPRRTQRAPEPRGRIHRQRSAYPKPTRSTPHPPKDRHIPQINAPPR